MRKFCLIAGCLSAVGWTVPAYSATKDYESEEDRIYSAASLAMFANENLAAAKKEPSRAAKICVSTRAAGMDDEDRKDILRDTKRGLTTRGLAYKKGDQRDILEAANTGVIARSDAYNLLALKVAQNGGSGANTERAIISTDLASFLSPIPSNQRDCYPFPTYEFKRPAWFGRFAFLVGQYSSPCGSSQIRLALVREHREWHVAGYRHDFWTQPHRCDWLYTNRLPDRLTERSLLMLSKDP